MAIIAAIPGVLAGLVMVWRGKGLTRSIVVALAVFFAVLAVLILFSTGFSVERWDYPL